MRPDNRTNNSGKNWSCENPTCAKSNKSNNNDFWQHTCTGCGEPRMQVCRWPDCGEKCERKDMSLHAIDHIYAVCSPQSDDWVRTCPFGSQCTANAGKYKGATYQSDKRVQMIGHIQKHLDVPIFGCTHCPPYVFPDHDNHRRYKQPDCHDFNPYATERIPDHILSMLRPLLDADNNSNGLPLSPPSSSDEPTPSRDHAGEDDDDDNDNNLSMDCFKGNLPALEPVSSPIVTPTWEVDAALELTEKEFNELAGRGKSMHKVRIKRLKLSIGDDNDGGGNDDDDDDDDEEVARPAKKPKLQELTQDVLENESDSIIDIFLDLKGGGPYYDPNATSKTRGIISKPKPSRVLPKETAKAMFNLLLDLQKKLAGAE